MPSQLRRFIEITGLALIYYITAKFGLQLGAVAGFASLVWAPSGIAIAAFFVRGLTVWPGVLLGAMWVNLHVGAPLWVSIFIGLGNTLAALFAFTFLRKFKFSADFERVRDVLLFVGGAAVLSTTLSASCGVAALFAAKLVESNLVFPAWRAWWLGDMMGNLVVAPLILVWSRPWQVSNSPVRLAEIISIIGALIISSFVIVVDSIFPGQLVVFPRPYFLFPILMVVALRLGQRGLVAAHFWVSFLLIWYTATGNGRFWNGNLTDSLLAVQIFLATLVISKFVLAAIVSERRKQRIELEKSIAQRESILDAALDCIITIDAQGRIVEFNPAAQKLFDYKLDEVVGQDMADLIIPDRMRAAHHRGIQAFLRTGYGPVLGKRIELTAKKRDGSEFSVEISIQALKSEGPPLFTGFLRDITDRKRAEESERFLAEVTQALSESIELKQTLGNLMHSLVPRSADWCAVHVFNEGNQNFQIIQSATANTANKAIFDELIAKYLSGPGGPTILAKVIEELKTQFVQKVTDDFLRSISSDDHHAELLRVLKIRSVVVTPLLLKGKMLGAISLVLVDQANPAEAREFTRADVLLFEELARRAAIAIDNARNYQQAREAIMARDEFLSIASHELKTPLTALSLQLQLFNRRLKKALQDQGGIESDEGEVTLPRKAAKNLLNSETQSHRLAKLLDELLDLTRIRAGRLQLSLEPVNLGNLVREIGEGFRAEASQKSIPLSIQAPLNDPALEGVWDRIRIGQVITNLISNAFKYGEGSAIEIGVEPLANHRGFKISVRDHGRGIPKDMLGKIFERFERAGMTDQQIAGIGLGLYICRQITESHGGRIWVESELDRGSNFIVELPISSEGVKLKSLPVTLSAGSTSGANLSY